MPTFHITSATSYPQTYTSDRPMSRREALAALLFLKPEDLTFLDWATDSAVKDRVIDTFQTPARRVFTIYEMRQPRIKTRHRRGPIPK